ncbi:hypothetical protein L1049_001930 [Liquidambar formosana]|uniref:Uncharacterized protein n=1 Tax=Liquidambar formosana TaxID=63359 RepID=A0AAP0NI80_LIQFO
MLIAKASIIQALNHHKLSLSPPFSSFISLYKPLLLTHLCNLLLIVAANTAAFSYFVFLKTYGFPSNNPLFALAAGVLFYSFLANTVVICNLALVVAGMENCSGYPAIRKAFSLRRGTNSMALLLALPLGLPAVEALFRYRVVKAYHLFGRASASMALEGLFIACLYSLLIVLDTIASCLFFKNSRAIFRTNQGDSFYCQIELVEVEEEEEE